MKLIFKLLLPIIFLVAGIVVYQVLDTNNTTFCKGENCLITNVYNCETKEKPNMVDGFKMPGPEAFMITTCHARLNSDFNFEKDVVTILDEEKRSIRYEGIGREDFPSKQNLYLQTKNTLKGTLVKQENIPGRKINLRYCFSGGVKYDRLKIIVNKDGLTRLVKGGNTACQSYSPGIIN